MCGIAGLLDPRRETGTGPLEEAARAMAGALAHRGPDDAGVWSDAAEGAALSHRRLSIIDLSSAGHQPMTSASGRTTLVCNGELYNHRELRAELEALGRRFRGRSDTEVFVEAIDAWGVRRALERANGMFAIGVWDASWRALTLARDRLGEKPLYYGTVGGRFAFASELRGLRALPGFDASIDEHAVAAYLRWSYVPHPMTIHRGVSQLAPGELLHVRVADGRIMTDPVRWWSIEDAAARGQASRRAPLDPDAEDRLVDLLGDAVRMRLEADVPMGAFLSGGIDSSMVAALAQQALGSTRLRTFTMRMPDVAFDESADAARVAAHLGTDHTTVDLSARDALAAIPDLAGVWDEPFGDPSMLPTLLLCRAARRQLTVSLGGDGGDEVFAGYNRHALGYAIWRRVGRVPRPLRRGVSRALLLPSPRLVDATARRARGVLPKRWDVRNPGDKVQKLASLLRADGSDLWAVLASTWPRPEEVLAGRATATDPRADRHVCIDPVEELLLLDTAAVLPDEMLVKVDRASMAVALEVRVPFLDHRVVEWAWTLPMEAKAGGGEGKRLVRQALRRFVPPEVVERPKMGFDPPVAAWLRGPLRPWAEDLLAEARLRADGWFDAAALRATWDEHQSGRRNWDYRLWAVLMFNAWLDAQGR